MRPRREAVAPGRCSRRRALAAVAAASLGLAGCAPWMPPQALALHERAPADLPRRVEHAAVPFFPQTPFHCGPAALAMVLQHAGLDAEPEALAAATFLPAREGTLQTEMLAAARRQGAWAQRLPRELEALLRELAAGHAVVVLVNLGLAIAPRWHYAVGVGYDLDAGVLILRSGSVRREVWTLRTFEHTWARGGHWAFVALPPEALGATVTREEALAAAIGFERVAAPAASARAYCTLLARWPDEVVAWMGLGNAAHAAQDWPAATAAFERAAALGAGLAAWNNLALARLRGGDGPAALQAAERAAALAESPALAGDSAALEPLRAAARETLVRVRRELGGGGAR